MSTSVQVKGLSTVLRKMREYPQQLQKVLLLSITATLLIFWENVPKYPIREGSHYRRTGTLGRSLGSSMEGGKRGGAPSIFTVKALGQNYVGRFGTNLEYAPSVIDKEEQMEIHKDIWWTITDIAEISKDKVNELWQRVEDQLANFLRSKKQ